jgi:uncharacterized membrane protein
MNGATKPPARSSENISTGFRTAYWIVFGLFLLALGFSITATFTSIELPGKETALVLFATATTLLSLSRQLSAQNVLLASVVIACIGSVIHSIGMRTGMPFGPFVYTREAGPQIFNTLSWSVPFIWVIAILNSRGVARLILRPWRKLRVYGFWLIGLTTALTLLLDLGLEPFATQTRHYWLWLPTKLPINWYGAPASNFLGWLVSTLLILAFTTPSLIKKKPVKSASDYHPLIVWNLLNALFITSAIARHFWLGAAISAAAGISAIVFAVRGARW